MEELTVKILLEIICVLLGIISFFSVLGFNYVRKIFKKVDVHSEKIAEGDKQFGMLITKCEERHKHIDSFFEKQEEAFATLENKK